MKIYKIKCYFVINAHPFNSTHYTPMTNITFHFYFLTKITHTHLCITNISLNFIFSKNSTYTKLTHN